MESSSPHEKWTPPPQGQDPQVSFPRIFPEISPKFRVTYDDVIQGQVCRTSGCEPWRFYDRTECSPIDNIIDSGNRTGSRRQQLYVIRIFCRISLSRTELKL